MTFICLPTMLPSLLLVQLVCIPELSVMQKASVHAGKTMETGIQSQRGYPLP